MMYTGWGFGWLWGIGFLVLVVAGVILIVWLVASPGRSQRQPPPAWPTPPPAPARPDPLDILRERFARGEISLEEFETAKRALGYPSSAAPQPGGWQPPGAPPAEGPPPGGPSPS